MPFGFFQVFLKGLLERRRRGGFGELRQRAGQLLFGVEQIAQLVDEVSAE